MWRSQRKSSSREIETRRSFTHSSFKDVVNLFGENDCNGFKTLDQPSLCSTASTAVAAARRLSVFHRVHLANKFARAFATKQTITSPKCSPELINVTADEKPVKSAARVVPEKRVESINVPADEKPVKSAARVVVEKRVDSINVAADEKPVKAAARVISIPGAEKRVVVYTTSLRVVRSTFEACHTVNSILRGFRVSIDERDLSMDSRFLNELHSIMTEAEIGEEECEKTKLTLPRVFIGGRYIGGAEEVRQLHETGELKKFIESLPPVAPGVCGGCGDFRFVLCDECNGSHKCYSEKGGFRSCTLCNENGLVRCSSCLDR